MTSRIVRQGPDHHYPGELKEIVILCDHIDCDTAVNDSQVREGGGLKNMGWTVMPMDGQLNHYCPDHNRNNSDV